MTEPNEAAKAAAAEIFPSMSEERRLQSTASMTQRRKVAERIIERHTAALREEKDRLLQVVDDSIEYVAPGWGGDARCRSFELVALCQQLYKSERELDDENERLKEEKFLPLGDNHHNALACPYCNGPLKEENERLKQQLAKATNQEESTHD